MNAFKVCIVIQLFEFFKKEFFVLVIFVLFLLFAFSSVGWSCLGLRPIPLPFLSYYQKIIKY